METRDVPQRPVGGRTIHVVPGSEGGDGSETAPFQGLKTAWTAASPGDTILVHAGSYGGVTDADLTSGTQGNPVVIRAFGDGDAVFDFIEVFHQSHLWFEGLTFRFNGNETGFYSCLTKATGMEANGLQIGRSCFDWLEVPGPAPMTSVPSQWITLRASCAAVDAGVVLPNVNDDFFGAAPDMGAHENGRPLPHYGPRE